MATPLVRHLLLEFEVMDSKRKPEGLEPFYQRFARILGEAKLSDTEVGSIMGLSSQNVGRLKSGQRKSVRLEAGLRLCERLNLDPWLLALGRERPSLPASGETPPRLPEDLADALDALRKEVRLAVETADNAQATADEAKRLAERRGRKGA